MFGLTAFTDIFARYPIAVTGQVDAGSLQQALHTLICAALRLAAMAVSGPNRAYIVVAVDGSAVSGTQRRNAGHQGADNAHARPLVKVLWTGLTAA